MIVFFFSSRRRHTRLQGDWSSDVCSSDLEHGCADFRTARPLAPPLPGMGLVGVQPVGIGLHDFTRFEKEQAELSVGMRATNASAWSRAARSRAVMSFGSRGSLLCNARHSAAG